MIYKIELDNYELNRLKCAMLSQYTKDKQYRDTCLKTGNFDGADLSNDSMLRNLQLLGKLEEIQSVKEGE